MKCQCGRPMTLLLISWVCDACSPVSGQPVDAPVPLPSGTLTLEQACQAMFRGATIISQGGSPIRFRLENGELVQRGAHHSGWSTRRDLWYDPFPDSWTLDSTLQYLTSWGWAKRMFVEDTDG